MAMNYSLKGFVVLIAIIVISVSIVNSSGRLPGQRRMEQTPEVIEAYRVCNKFQRLMSEDLDFDLAYEAAFPRNLASRRAIAIAEGGFKLKDYSAIPSELLIKAYKLQMQIIYLAMPLGGPSEEEAKLFFPPRIKSILERRPPAEPGEFAAFVQRLERDVIALRAHIRRLSDQSALAASRIREFKSQALAANLEPPSDRRVEPAHGYYRSGVLASDVAYYQVSCFTVARVDGVISIVGINFFTRLF